MISKDFMHWQIRFRQKGTQIICFKKKFFDFVQDPYLKTTTWDDPKLALPRPPRVEAEKINGSGIGEGTADTIFSPVLQYRIEKMIPLTKQNESAFDVQGQHEKYLLRQVLLFGENENDLTPVYIGRKKTTSGKYMQSADQQLLNVSDEKVKSFWYGIIRSAVVKE